MSRAHTLYSGDALDAATHHAPTEGVSVIMCAYNSESRIERTLTALARCQLPANVECLVVNNNSNDNTSDCAAATWSRMAPEAFEFRIVDEPQQGLAFARRRGVAEAKYDILIFCDDDNLLDADYLVKAVEIMSDESIGAVSGIATPASDVAFPGWFFSFAQCYAVGLQLQDQLIAGGSQVDLSGHVDRCPWGAGLVVRRALIQAVYEAPHVPLLSDRKGLILTSGGDYEICHLIAISGHRLVIDGQLRLEHFIPSERLTLNYLSRLQAGFLAQADALATYSSARHFYASGKSRDWLRLLKTLIKVALGRAQPSDMFVIALYLGVDWFRLTELQRKVLANASFVRARSG